MADTCTVESDITASDQEPRELRAQAVRGGGAYLVCRWAAQLLGCLVTLGVARLLTAMDYGVITAGAMLLGFADFFTEAGIGRAIVQQKGVSRRECDEAFTVTLLLSLGCYGVVSAAAPLAAQLLHTAELVAFLPVMGIVLLLSPFRTIPLAILDRRLQVHSQGILALVTTAAQAAMVLGLALAGAGYWSLAGGALLARVIEVGFLLRWAKWTPRLVLPGKGAVRLFRFSLPVISASLLLFFYNNSDYAVVGHLAGPVALGYYGLAFQLMSLPVQKIVANVNKVAFPFFCRLQGDPSRLKSWYLRLITLLMLIVLPVLLGAALVAKDGIVLVLGEKWSPAVLPFQLLSGVGVVMVVSTPLVALLNAMGRPDISFKYAAACALALPASFAAAGWAYGVTGVCVVWVIGYPVLVGLLIHLTRHLTGVGLRDLFIRNMPILAAGLFMAACVLVLQRLPVGSTPGSIRLVAVILGGAASYSSIVWLTARRTILADVGTIWREVRGKVPQQPPLPEEKGLAALALSSVDRDS